MKNILLLISLFITFKAFGQAIPPPVNPQPVPQMSWSREPSTNKMFANRGPVLGYWQPTDSLQVVRMIGGISPTLTFNNGTSKSGNIVGLGGNPLIRNTIIPTATFTLAIGNYSTGANGDVLLQVGSGVFALIGSINDRIAQIANNFGLQFVSTNTAGGEQAIRMLDAGFKIKNTITNDGVQYDSDPSTLGHLNPLWIPNYGYIQSYFVDKSTNQTILGNKLFKSPVIVTDTTNGSALTLNGNGTALTVNGFAQFNSNIGFVGNLTWDAVTTLHGLQFYKSGDPVNYYQLVFDPATLKFGSAYDNGSFKPFATQHYVDSVAAGAGTGVFAVLSGGNSFTGAQYLNTTTVMTAPDSIAFLGDSYIAGYGVQAYQRMSTIAAGKLNAIEVNLGVGGSTVEEQSPTMPFGVSSYVARRATIPVYNSHYLALVINGSINDPTLNSANYNVTNYTTDLGTNIIDYAVSVRGWPAGKILLVSQPYKSPTSYVSRNGNPAATDAINISFANATKAVATAKGTQYLDQYNLLKNNGGKLLEQADSLHLNPSGHRIVGNAIANSVGLIIKQNGQQLAVNGLTQLSKMRLSNTDTLQSKGHTIIVADSLGNIVYAPNKYISNAADTVAANAQGANININGNIRAASLNSNGLTTSTGRIWSNTYFQSSGAGLYPASKTGMLLVGTTGSGYIDSFSPTSANTGQQLQINSQSLGDVNIYGNVNFKSTGKLTTLSSPLVVNTYLQFPNATGGYPATKTGGLMTTNTTAFFIDGFNASGTAIPIYLNNQAPGANVESYGNFFVRNAKSFNVATGTSTFGGPVFITPFSTAGIISNSSAGQLSSITTIPVANGGTGQTTLTANSLLVGNGTTAITQLGNTLTNAILVNTASGGAPTYSATPFIGGLLTLQNGLTVSAGNISMSGGGQLIGPGVTGTTTNSTVGIQARPFTSAGTAVQLANSAVSNSTGSFVGVSIIPTYTQTGSTGATDLTINRTEISVGSGNQRILDLQRNSVSMFNVDRLGHAMIEGVTSTGATGTGNIVYSISPTLTGSPLAPTQTAADNSTKIATTAYVDLIKIDNVLTKTANYTILLSDWVAGKTNVLRLGADATSGNITITFPAASSLTGYVIYVTKKDASVNTVTESGPLGISILATQLQSSNWYSDGTSWYPQ